MNGLHTESRTDPLTGLANRRSLMERIEMEMAHALRAETPLSVAMIDLDHFKDFNDRYGHVVGDTVLRSVAAMMVSNTRDQDLVARYGGEEFCLVLPDTDLVGGHHILDHLRAGGRDATDRPRGDHVGRADQLGRDRGPAVVHRAGRPRPLPGQELRPRPGRLDRRLHRARSATALAARAGATRSVPIGPESPAASTR